MNLVVDASVACKWYLDEELSDAAREVADIEGLLVAPDLVLAETGNVLHKRRKAGLISDQQAREAAWHLKDVFVLISSQELIERALEIARALDHSIYDCFYLAAAERWNAPLVTADDHLLRKAAPTEWKARTRDLREFEPSR